MKHLTFWVAFDHRYGTNVIVGYKVLYEGLNHDSEEYENKRLCHKGIENNSETVEFDFHDGEYITHLGVSTGASLDRVEFTTNTGRHFVAGGKGGKYIKLNTSSEHSHANGEDHHEHEHYHPRFISFMCSHGELDVTSFGGMYLLVPGSCD